MDLHTLTLKIQRSENLPVLPTVVVQILRLFDDPTVSPRTLEKIIEQDPALTAKLLRIAGSSMYGMQSATSVARALSVLGMNTLPAPESGCGDAGEPGVGIEKKRALEM